MVRGGRSWIVVSALAVAGAILVNGLLLSVAALVNPAAAAVPRCDDVPAVVATGADQYRDEATYDGSAIPLGRIQQWAEEQPGFEGMWLDGRHNKWVTLAFSHDAAERQVDVEQLFPGAGALTVLVDWTTAELESLGHAVIDHAKFRVTSAKAAIERGVVRIGVPDLDATTLAAVESQFGGQRVCIERTSMPVAFP